jgi:excisionase family DNA binding protein
MAKINDFMTVGQASAYLGVSKDSLRRWDRAGKLKARRHPVSRYRLYLKSDLDTFLHRFTADEVQTGRPNRTEKMVKRVRTYPSRTRYVVQAEKESARRLSLR